jgi:hypothetical protein
MVVVITIEKVRTPTAGRRLGAPNMYWPSAWYHMLGGILLQHNQRLGLRCLQTWQVQDFMANVKNCRPKYCTPENAEKPMQNNLIGKKVLKCNKNTSFLLGDAGARSQNRIAMQLRSY